MIDSIMLIGAGLAGLVLIFFAAGAVLSFIPALAIFCGELWMRLFSWMLGTLKIVILFVIFVVCMLIIGPL
jgi:hypothetical protein